MAMHEFASSSSAERRARAKSLSDYDVAAARGATARSGFNEDWFNEDWFNED